MKEIEVKILDIDRKEVEKKLVSLGARKIFDGILEARYYDFQDYHLKKSGVSLRLRKENKRVVLTLKKKVPDANLKVRDEYEIEMLDY